MARKKVEFSNGRGQTLAGSLELPDGKCGSVALFAHCFTCTKNSAAAARISGELAKLGIGVLRFDFTGLGNSDGDFANTNFSSNVDDLVAAANYLEKNVAAPVLLIGHSLGGAAMLAAAPRIKSSRAVVTIGAPATASHLKKLLATARDEIVAKDEALVELGRQRFTIKKQLLDDIDKYGNTRHLGKLGKALLVFHSPLDQIVSIDEAERIYKAAKHPKSFVSLDKADHLVSSPTDAGYIAGVLAAWAKRYMRLPKPEEVSMPAPGKVLVEEENRRYTRRISTHKHVFLADEPDGVGDDLGPNPYELLLAALGACTSMTLRMYAKRKGLALESIRVHLSHSRVHAKDCETFDPKRRPVDWIGRQIELEGELSDAEKQRLLEIADRCPVHRTLQNEIVVSAIAPPCQDE